MGHGTYSYDTRSLRAASKGYHTKSVDQIFTQQIERRVHESMSPKGVEFRECRDSEDHPNALPIILAMDVTGSMGHIPHDLVKDGLPTLMDDLIQNGLNDASVLFMSIGDHECDSYPLQVGQFESSDETLDMWLTRSYLEGGGGGNAGESYLLAWYFAAFHTRADHFEKRNKRGFIFSFGDEPCLKVLPLSAKKEIMGEAANGDSPSAAKDLLEAAKKNYHVFHLAVKQGYNGGAIDSWKKLLGQNVIPIDHYQDIPKTVAKIIRENSNEELVDSKVVSSEENPNKSEEIL